MQAELPLDNRSVVFVRIARSAEAQVFGPGWTFALPDARVGGCDNRPKHI